MVPIAMLPTVVPPIKMYFTMHIIIPSLPLLPSPFLHYNVELCPL